MADQATAVNVTVASVVVASPTTYRGFSIGSTAGATVTLYDNATTNTGTVLAQFTLAANGWLSDDITDGVRCLNGIYMSATAAVQGHVRIG
jgi:hypothetical protein